MSYQVVTAELSGLVGVAAVHLATRRSAYAGLLPAEVLDEMTAASLQRWWTRRLTEAPRPHRLVVAVAEGPRRGVLGFTHVGPGRPGLGELYAIHVHPRAQGTGLGRRLLSAAGDALRDFGYLRAELWVLEGNRSAQGFYRRHGWQLLEGSRGTEGLEGATVVEVGYERGLGRGQNVESKSPVVVGPPGAIPGRAKLAASGQRAVDPIKLRKGVDRVGILDVLAGDAVTVHPCGVSTGVVAEGPSRPRDKRGRRSVQGSGQQRKA